MTKLLTWTLKTPNDWTFPTYIALADGANWWDNNYYVKDATAPETNSQWTYSTAGFIRMIEKYTDKFYAIGCHNFEVGPDGRVYNTTAEKFTLPTYDSNGVMTSTGTAVLSDDKTTILNRLPYSLLYLMHNYPSIKWSLQFLCTTNSNGNRVEPMLDNTNGIQDVFINEVYQIMSLYLSLGFTNIKGVEIDFEKATSRKNEANKFRDLLVRVKNEVCIPLGLELRVNLLAMTDDFTPDYYAWHDYGTVASGKDLHGNQAIDEFQLMSYDFSWGGSAPGPSTPLDWLTKILNHVQDLDNRGIWNSEDVFIGNAAYGRRWPLGEWDTYNNRDRWGTTMDYKQLIVAQNGGYIHNNAPVNASGDNSTDGHFYFNDQDFIPIAGFNDDSSSYQKTYLNVYDRFNVKSNGGADYTTDSSLPNNVNANKNLAIVTNYSRRQYCSFGGVQAVLDTPTATSGGTSLVQINPNDDSTLVNLKRSTGLSGSNLFPNEYRLNVDSKTGQSGTVEYDFNLTGNYRLIAYVRWPFFTNADLWFTLNGNTIDANGNLYDWNPFMQAQEAHFFDLGVQTFNGANVISISNTNGAYFNGFVICQDFAYNLRGGEVTFPATCFPMKRRDTVQPDDTITLKDAQYPTVMRIVGEILTRTPRPAIIWEDIWSSYLSKDVPTANAEDQKYYPLLTNGGFSRGNWPIQANPEYPDTSASAFQIYNDARGGQAQLLLNHQFSCDIAVELQVQGTDAGAYGIRALTSDGNDGYLCLLDFNNQAISISYTSGGIITWQMSKPMDSTFVALNGQSLRLRVYVLGDKISFWVEDTVHFDRVTMPTRPASGAYGIYNQENRIQVFKYNISTLNRFERMERLEIDVDGQTYTYDKVSRPDAVYDEFDFINYTAYPGEIAYTVATPSQDENSSTTGSDTGSSTGTVTNDSTVLSLESPAYTWLTDYSNKDLAEVPAWTGTKNVVLRFIDAGIWLRSFYVGDNQGMSVAYNGDRNAFIKTANLVNDYNCKGIGMWTLGQEDPSLFPYISG